MGSSLLGIPGVHGRPGARRPRRPNRGRRGRAQRKSPNALAGRNGWRDRPSLAQRVGAMLGSPWLRLLALVLLVAAAFMGWRASQVQVQLVSEDGVLAFPSAVAGNKPLRLEVQGGGGVTAALSGVVLDMVERRDSAVTIWLPNHLPQGGYELRVAVDRPFPFGRTKAAWTVAIDDQAPALTLDAAPPPSPLNQSVTLSGTVEAGARLSLADPSATPFRIDPDSGPGQFRLVLERPPVAAVEVVATDAAGNVTRLAVTVIIAYPGDTRAVHVSAAAWADAGLRQPVLGLIDRGLINAVVVDLKDDAGIVGYRSEVALAQQVGAVRAHYGLGEVVEAVHAKGARLIGRVVAFRDPQLSAWAWKNGHPDWVLQDRRGQPLADFGGFTNYVQQPVRDYNLALAEEAAKAGFDEILWDGLQRPEGDPETMMVPGLTGTALTTADMLVEFLGQAQARLRPLGVYQGATLTAAAATRPENVGQPVDRFAPWVDYLAPTLYPSGLAAGECDLVEPARQPAAAVSCGLSQIAAALAAKPSVPSGVGLVPWLQDFSAADIGFGPVEVAAQIQATSAASTAGYLLWNPSGVYSLGRSG